MRRAVRYAGATLRGEPAAPLGQGFDRWGVFLRKAGVAWPPLLALGLVALAGAGFAGVALARGLRGARAG